MNTWESMSQRNIMMCVEGGKMKRGCVHGENITVTMRGWAGEGAGMIIYCMYTWQSQVENATVCGII